MKSNEYECSVCHGIFEYGWSDEEAKAELADNWPGFVEDDCDICCDDCHKEFMKWFSTQSIG